MGKISPVSSKYIIHASINIDGVVDKPDVIGAIFGQTEGLLGSDLELRELQRSGRIGRIEVNVDTKSGKTQGSIIIPSSLDKAETSIVGAALEIIQRIGPCNAKIRVQNIEDVRVSKRQFVIDRAKELLKQLQETVMPDSQELADEVAYSVRAMEITDFGSERLPAGPAVEESDEIIVCEGRADVLTLLKQGFKNAIAMNGTSVPKVIIDLSRRKVVTAFVDGDRGGSLIVRELMLNAEIDFVARAPDGKEVEELTKKEIHKAMRSRIAIEQAKLEYTEIETREHEQRRPPQFNNRPREQRPMQRFQKRPIQQQQQVPKRLLTPEEKKQFKSMLEDLIGTRGAYLVDDKMSILGKVPITEIAATIKSLGKGVYAVVFDGQISQDIVSVGEQAGLRYVVGMDSAVKGSGRVGIVTINDL